MKGTTKKFILIGLVVFLGQLDIYNANYNYYQEKNFENIENDDEFELNRAGSWEIGPIEIDDDNPAKNWSFTEASYEWCNGSGTINDPYIIENVTINGTGAINGILIENSNAYFMIRNCIVYNASSRGIRLKNVDNGVIYNTTSSQNFYGIFISRANFVNISNNFVIGNSHNGIEIGSFSSRCIVSDNVIIDNNQNGIVLRQANVFCNITNNTVSGHIYSGIHIQGESNYNNVLFNTVKDNPGDGISIYHSNHNNVSVNNIYNNKKFGFVIREEGSNNIFSQNTMIGCGIGFSQCGTTTITSNIIDNTNLVNGKEIFYFINEDSLMPYDFINPGQIILVNCINCLISNLNVSNGGGISLYSCDNNEITGNIVDFNYRGISLDRSDDNAISGNSADYNRYGIYLHYSKNNTASSNTANNNEHGIYVGGGDFNTISQNTANYNEYGITISGRFSNSVLGNYINYNNYGIYLFMSDNNKISGNSLIGNNVCISESYCEGNVFTNNNCGDAILGYDVIFLIVILSAVSIITAKRIKNHGNRA